MLRAAVVRRFEALLPGWPPAADSADVEVWVLQVGPTTYRVGLRIPGLGARAGGRRLVERPGSWRPAAAAAMVHLAGEPRGLLVDPCCGSGTILAEAERAGWSVLGGDRDAGAVEAATLNTGGVIALLDARRLPLATDAAQAVVTNLPFGEQHRVQGLPVAWYRRALAEASRVAPVLVVLATASAPYRQALGRLPLRLRSKHDIVLLGRRASIWTLERTGSTSGGVPL